MTGEVTYDVSVVLALNKIDKYSFKAIDSILYQKDINHEVILIANGSDASVIYMSLNERYKGQSKIKIVATPIPQLAFSLNLGVSNSSSDYIARMDADDVAFPDRLSKQLYYMLENQLDLLGSDVLLINEHDEVIGSRVYPKSQKSISKTLYRSNPFCHPSVMYKKELFYKARGYNSGFNSEDYDFWLRCMKFCPKWDNMPNQLLKYRIHSATSQGNILAYSEVSGYFLREFLLAPSIAFFLGGFVAVMKTFYTKFRKVFESKN